MMKYLLCILSLAFLLRGLSPSPHEKNAERLQQTTEVSAYSCAMPTTAFASTPMGSHSLGVLTFFSLPRNITPIKTLKFNDIPVIVRLLSSRSFRLPEDKRRNLLTDTNSLKYLNRYYIYTLGHILI